MRGWVGADAQAVLHRRRVEIVEHDAGFDDGIAFGGVQLHDTIQQARGDDDPSANGIAGDAGARAAHGQRCGRLTTDANDRGQLGDVGGLHHQRGQHTVQRRIRGEERARTRVGVDAIVEHLAQSLLDVLDLEWGSCHQRPFSSTVVPTR